MTVAQARGDRLLASSGVINNCTAIILSLAVLLSGIGAVSGAPAGDQEWWINPCNKQPMIRHHRSPAESQLRRFLVDMDKKFLKEIKDMYQQPNDNVKYKGNCPKINNLLRAIDNASSFNSATQAFYETLLQFAVFIDRLKETPVSIMSEGDPTRRSRIFEDARVNLRLLICEYNDTLSRQESKHPVRENRKRKHLKPKVPQMNMKCLPKSMDQSHAHYMDIDFFKKLQKFLKQSRRILRTKKRSGKRSANRGGGKRTRKPKT